MSPLALEILYVLSNNLRFLSVSQVAGAWYFHLSSAERLASKLARELSSQGWINIHQIFCRPLLPMQRPLVQWQHAQPTPDFEELSRWLSQRSNSKPEIVTVVCATAFSRSLFHEGKSMARLKLTQATHDLHVGEIFLTYRRNGFEFRKYWISEDSLPQTWPVRQRPDAVLLDQHGDFLRAVEYGGDYSVDRLFDLHQGLASIPLAYEIW